MINVCLCLLLTPTAFHHPSVCRSKAQIPPFNVGIKNQYFLGNMLSGGVHIYGEILFSQHTSLCGVSQTALTCDNKHPSGEMREISNDVFTRLNLCAYARSRFNHPQSFQLFIQKMRR
jgi:hypothetical protein